MPTPSTPKKAPAVIRFVPDDWLADMPLRSVSSAARGLWIDALCLITRSPKHGCLMLSNGTPIDNGALAKLTGNNQDDVADWVTELEQAKVFSRDASGCIYNRRMVREQQKKAVVPPRMVPVKAPIPAPTKMPSVPIVFDGEAYQGITPADMAHWRKLYPSLDIQKELGKSIEWLRANPAKLKRNYRQFLFNWFCTAEDRMRKNGTNASNPQPQRSTAREGW